MLEAMRDAGVTRLVYSLDRGGLRRAAPRADRGGRPHRADQPYGATKLAFEGAMRWFAASHDFRGISLRYFNVAGATERNGEDHDPETHLMPLVLRVAAGEATHVQIFGQDYPTPDGTCIRDFIHVRDLAAAHLLALEATGEGDPSLEVYNLGSAAGFSVREVVEAARKRHRPPDSGPRRSSAASAIRRCSSHRRVARGASSAGSREHSKLEQMLTDAWAWRRGPPERLCRRRSQRLGAGHAEADRRLRQIGPGIGQPAAPPASSATAGGAQAVEVEARVVDLEAALGRQPLGHGRDVGLADLLHPTASVAGEVVMVLGPAGDVAVHVPVLLEAAGEAGRHQRLERAEDGGAPDARIRRRSRSPQLLRGDRRPTASTHPRPAAAGGVTRSPASRSRSAVEAPLNAPPTAPAKTQKA